MTSLLQRWAWWLFALASSLSWGSAWAYSITDSSGHRTEFSQPPQRIVSLLPSLAETVCALGACQRLVGVDRYTVWPPEMAKVKKVGGGLDPHIEAIVALRPDVVLVSHASRASGRLRNLGLKVLVMEPKTHADVRQTNAILAAMLQLPAAQAEALWQRNQADIAESAAQIPPAVRGQKVYFEVSPGPFAAGPSSFIGETIAQVGLGNVVAGDLGPFPKLNPEYVVRGKPDWILIGQRSSSQLARYPGWSQLPAMRAGRVCVFNDTQMDIMIHPGPRMGQAARLLLDCVQGRIAGLPKGAQP